jgi:hypothetical protein
MFRILLPLFLLLSMSAMADGPGRILAARVQRDAAPIADPANSFWRGAVPVRMAADSLGQPVRGHDTEIRALWTKQNLYLLFVCQYNNLFLNAAPRTDVETARLWEHDVAEVFIGAEMDRITRYREYQVSPAGEWVDLDIDRVSPLPEGGWKWNSGFKVAARVVKEKKLWYGAFQIPIASINGAVAKAGAEMRVNFYRFQGPPTRVGLSWQPTGARNYHVPEAFGRLVLQ